VPENLQDYPAVMPASLLLGPMPAPDIQTYFNGRANTTWLVRGEEEMLGVKAQIVEVTGPGGDAATYWIEPEHVFILRYEMTEQSGWKTSARIEELELDAKLDGTLFSFEPPAGALGEEPKETLGWSSGLIGAPTFPKQEGFLAPDYLPAGYVTKSSGGTTSNGRRTLYRVTLGPSRDGPATLYVEQQFRAGGLAAPPTNSTTMDIAGRTGYRNSAGGEETLTWAVDDVIVTLRSSVLPFKELLRVAASMK
jgi:hypothetical protein